MAMKKESVNDKETNGLSTSFVEHSSCNCSVKLLGMIYVNYYHSRINMTVLLGPGPSWCQDKGNILMI